MAGTIASSRVCNKNKGVAVAMAVALLALLFAAAAGKTCNVDLHTVFDKCKSCSSGRPSDECCKALKDADFVCLCRDYWNELKHNEHYASCVKAIPTDCKLPKAKCY